MRATAENVKAVKAVMSKIAGRFGGGFPLTPEYLAEMGDALLECPTLAVFEAVARDLLSMAPTDANGARRVPTPYDVRANARAHEPPKPECPRCDGTGFLHHKRYAKDPCGTGQASYDVAERCPCGTVYRPPKEPENAGMTDIKGMLR